VDDDETCTGSAMSYGHILAEAWKAHDGTVVADLDAWLIEVSTGIRWIKTGRP
jgi:hypothetical protein